MAITRANLITALSSLTSAQIGGLNISQELPWVNAGDPLYIKNPKRVYVDREVRDETTSVVTLDNSVRGVTRATIIRAYVAVDAKTQPSGFNTAVANIANLKNHSQFADQQQRECNYTQEFDEDLLITTFEFQFRETAIN